MFGFLGPRLIGYTSGKRANVLSGAVSALAMLGVSPSLGVAGSPTVAAGILTFDGVDDTAQVAAITTITASLPLVKAYDMPNAAGSGPEGGFTFTGAYPYPVIAGGFVAGNDGRNSTGGSNANASIVICQIVEEDDEVIKVDEFLMSDYPAIITTPGSIQGVTWIPAEGLIAFAHLGMLKVYYIDPVTRVMTASPGDPIADLNGLSYDPETDCIITGSATGSVFRDRATFTAIGRNISGGSDGLFYDVARRELWRTTGSNDVDGVLYVTPATPDGASGINRYALTLEGAKAVEGIWRDGQRIYVANDRGFHAPSPPSPDDPQKNRLLVYDLPPLIAAPRWPIGQTVQLFGKIRQAANSASSSRLVVGVGDSTSAVKNGIAVFIPNSTLTTLRVIVNSTAINWTVASLATARSFFVSVSPRDGSAELWIDGVSIGVQTFTAQPLFWSDPSPMYLASDRGASRFWPGEMTAIGMAVDSAANRESILAAMAADIA